MFGDLMYFLHNKSYMLCLIAWTILTTALESSTWWLIHQLKAVLDWKIADGTPEESMLTETQY